MGGVSVNNVLLPIHEEEASKERCGQRDPHIEHHANLEAARNAAGKIIPVLMQEVIERAGLPGRRAASASVAERLAIGLFGVQTINKWSFHHVMVYCLTFELAMLSVL